MKDRILFALGRSQEYVSGQELCGMLGVSRTAVWKVINQLKEEGYEIAAVPRKGYKIISRPDVITAEEVASRLDTEWAGKNISYYERIDSTNSEAGRLAQNGAASGTLVLSEEQERGKGRRGRSWVTPRGSAVAMSLILRPDICPSHASMLTLVMGMAVASAIRERCGVEAMIKWPNDVVANGKKICGILTEMSSEIDYIRYIVIGTGINTHVEHFPEELKNTAVSLHELTGKAPDRAALIASCLKYFERYYGIFLETQDFSGLLQAYNGMLAGIGEGVRVLEPSGGYTGISGGINEKGELLVKRENGAVERVYAGEVSVRGIYGYSC